VEQEFPPERKGQLAAGATLPLFFFDAKKKAGLFLPAFSSFLL
jgi:hypothetical protein